MRSLRFCAAWVLGAALLQASYVGNATCRCLAEEPARPKSEPSAKPPTKPEDKSKFPEWDKVVEGAKHLEGLFSLYYNEKEQKLFMEVTSDVYEKEIILPIAIAKGAGLQYLGGGTLNFGNQWLISFRRAGDRVLVVRRNVGVRAEAGSPQADAVKISYTDSILGALPIKSERGSAVLIDLADLFMTDLPNIGIHPDPSRSTWAKVKVFPKNVEIELSAVFSMNRDWYYWLFGDDSVPDTRGAQVVIHYGMSMLPQTSYKPRLADDRVGHFLTVIKDFSQDVNETPKVRYVTRWNLEREKSSGDKSPPKQPLIFWIERTVPREYRQYVRDGILEWNKAFEKVGFQDAIQVRDQQSDDEFDPEDIRYNTFRWITTSAGFAMGPSRTNPKTGEILDADIIFDEGMIRYWRQEYLVTTGIPEGLSALLSGERRGFFRMFSAELPWFQAVEPALDRIIAERKDLMEPHQRRHSDWDAVAAEEMPCHGQCRMGQGMQRQLAMLGAVLAARGELDPGGKIPEKFIGQAIKEVVMHEVGHTLGLRHNFKASTSLSLQDVNNPEVTAKKGASGSIMDYLPANIVAKGEKQGDFFSPTIGAYDYWAIEYGYKAVEGNEKEELAKIAARAAEPDLTFGTDEDVWTNPDPRIQLFDLGDPLDYARDRIKLTKASLEDLQNRVVAKGEGWQRARTAFGFLLSNFYHASYLSTNYLNGLYTSRDHREDPNGRPPMKPIELAKQRDALRLLQEEILSDKAFQFKPELLRSLAPQHWLDRPFWSFFQPYQYPVLQYVCSLQRFVVSQLLDAETLRSIQEAKLLADPGQESLDIAEVFRALTDSIWTELPAAEGDLKKDQKIELSLIRRNLQREHISQLSKMVIGPRQNPMSFFYLLFFGADRPVPPDARSLAREHLRQINDRIGLLLGDKAKEQNVQLDELSRTHLTEIRDQIDKVFKASLEMNRL